MVVGIYIIVSDVIFMIYFGYESRVVGVDIRIFVWVMDSTYELALYFYMQVNRGDIR